MSLKGSQPPPPNPVSLEGPTHPHLVSLKSASGRDSYLARLVILASHRNDLLSGKLSSCLLVLLLFRTQLCVCVCGWVSVIVSVCVCMYVCMCARSPNVLQNTNNHHYWCQCVLDDLHSSHTTTHQPLPHPTPLGYTCGCVPMADNDLWVSNTRERITFIHHL